MAHMYPEDGPTKETTSDAERRLYDLLQRTLSDDYHVFHSAPWASKQEDGRIESGEVDFILVHPDHGILLLEVKGGGIAYDGTTKTWTSTDRHGQLQTIRDPFLQVSRSAHRLRRHLRIVAQTQRYAQQYWMGEAVWFPNIAWTPGVIPLPHVRDALVLDSSALLAPEETLRRIFHHARPDHLPPMSRAALEALIDVLAPTRQIRPLLRDEMRANQVEYLQLSDLQYRRLNTLLYYPRVAIRGAAGTGKTVIALEAARRYAKQGLDVLFVCVNPSLAAWITSSLVTEPEVVREHLTVQYVDALCLLLTAQAQRALGPFSEEEFGERDDLGDTWQQRRLGALFARCVNDLEAAGALPRYDAIIIDEAQDIERPLWTPLYKLLRDRRNGRFLAFYDPAQRLVEGDWSPPIPSGYRQLVLTDNCRNTQTIFSVAHQFYTGLEVPLCVGPEGRPVQCLDPAGDAPIPTAHTDAAVDVQALERILTTLIEQEGIAPRDILVVTCRSKKASALYGLRMVGKHQLTTELGTRNMQAVRIVTVRSAKGLEAPVVIVAELHGLDRVSKRSHYLYVATSRAQHHLIVLGSQSAFLPKQPSLATALIQPPTISSYAPK